MPGTRLREYLAPLGALRAKPTATLSEMMNCSGVLYERLWRPILLAGLNTDPPQGSAMLAAAMLRETLGAGGKACRPLIAIAGLSSCFIEPALTYLAARHMPLRLGERLRGIEFTEKRAVSLDFGADRTPLAQDDAVVLAVPPWVAQELLPDLAAPDEFRAIVNAHFRVTPRPSQPIILGVINGLTEWLFAYPDHISVTISCADRILDTPPRSTCLLRDLAQEVAALSSCGAGIATLADCQGKACDFRRNTGPGRQEAFRPHARLDESACSLVTGRKRVCQPPSKERCVRAIGLRR